MWATASLAQDESKATEKTTGILKFYVQHCPNGEAVSKMVDEFLAEYVATSGLSQEVAESNVDGIMQQVEMKYPAGPARDEICRTLKTQVVDPSWIPAPKASFSEQLLGKKANQIIEGLIIGAAGLLIGLVVGLLVWGVTRKNVLKLGWWFPAWFIAANAMAIALRQIVH